MPDYLKPCPFCGGTMPDYSKYRTKGFKKVEALVAENPGYRLVYGNYYCQIINSKEQHWWAEDENGKIHDPTCFQFLSVGRGQYEELKT